VETTPRYTHTSPMATSGHAAAAPTNTQNKRARATRTGAAARFFRFPYCISQRSFDAGEDLDGVVLAEHEIDRVLHQKTRQLFNGSLKSTFIKIEKNDKNREKRMEPKEVAPESEMGRRPIFRCLFPALGSIREVSHLTHRILAFEMEQMPFVGAVYGIMTPRLRSARSRVHWESSSS